MSQSEMSGSEDGQLRSPGDDDQIISGDDDGENDTDSLDIKPPQATLHHRDSSRNSRHMKSTKEKKHSKERKRKDRSSNEGGGTGTGGNSASDRDRGHHKSSRDISGGRGDGNNRKYHKNSSEFRDHRYEKDDIIGGGGSNVSSMSNDRRYPKHFDRHHVRGGENSRYHYQQQQQQNPHRHSNDYYDRGNNGNENISDYDYDYHHKNRHKHRSEGSGYDTSADFGGNLKRKYIQTLSYDNRQDAETLEQDLRSRLLSKRHKYVKEYMPTTRYQETISSSSHNSANHYEKRSSGNGGGGGGSGYESRREHHRTSGDYKEKRNDSVIEVMDSPENIANFESKSKLKASQSKDKTPSEENTKNRSFEDPELLARRSKLLEAEREMAKRKESARLELEARRELRRERNDVIDISSSSPVANDSLSNEISKDKLTKSKRKYDEDSSSDVRQKPKHKRVENKTEFVGSDEDDDVEDSEVEEGEAYDDEEGEEDDEEDDDDDDDDEEDDDGDEEDDDDDDEESSDSNVSEQSYDEDHKSKIKIGFEAKKKLRKQRDNEIDYNDDEDEELPLPDSPLSIGDLSKSLHKKRHRRHHQRKHKKQHNYRTSCSPHSHSKSPLVHVNDDDSSHSDSHHHSRSSHSRSSHRHSNSDYPSRSGSSEHSKSRSRSRSEERDMNLKRLNANVDSDSELRTETDSTAVNSVTGASGTGIDSSRKSETIGGVVGTNDDLSSAVDEKGVKLPNYHPGIQGCRSVEEFQCLNRIEEGTYGVVYRAKDKRTNEIVALKRLKMEKEKEGFPITSLREINTLLKGQHPNIVTVREIVVGSNMDKIFIVMDYVEHDLKSLMETMKHKEQSFFPGEIKCLTQQLLRAVGHLHDNWILHRDLKTSNLLLSHKGVLKVGDFGLAREYGSPLKKYTSLVVTLWYRAPELLLCAPEYSTPVDIWSVGCIFAEFLQMLPMFPGKSEIDQLNRIFKELGTPNEKIWPGYKDLPAVKNLLSQNSQFTEYPVSNLRKRFIKKTTETGIAFLQGLLTYDPKQRLTAETALKHPYFKELPLPIDPSMFPTWPAKSELGARKALASSPKPPSGGSQFKQLARDEIISSKAAAAANAIAGVSNSSAANSATSISGIISGNKKTSANTGFVLNANIDQRQLAMGPGFSLKF